MVLQSRWLVRPVFDSSTIATRWPCKSSSSGVLTGAAQRWGFRVLGFADVIEGTVYTILLRLEKNGLVQVTKRPSEQGPPRKFYALNDAGREELATFWAKWEYLSSRIDRLKEGGR
ncbi:PadR family transcriptional regulator [Saccharomonospora sp. NPDC046836]|uniref:PadR family transcriptional regulator n=1 Tax=Saccharomonospora sp. NPDC046836 TaxID=3156921 RepID=UPI0033E68C75